MSGTVDDILSLLGKLVLAAQKYPDLGCLLLGSLIGYVSTVYLERYFLPASTDPAVLANQKRLTFFCCWFVSTVAASELWAIAEIMLRDPMPDPARVRWTMSIFVEFLAFGFYPMLGRFITTKFPKVASSWVALPK